MVEKVVCIFRGQWLNGLGHLGPGPAYGEVCVIAEVRPPGRYRSESDGQTWIWDQPVDYYRLVGYDLRWFLSECFRPLDEIDRLLELIKELKEPAEAL